MNKQEIIKRLDEDFDIYKYHDVWGRFSDFIKDIEEYIKPVFQEHSCGLMIDFSETIDEIITTTFITENIFDYLKQNKKKNILIFSHHPFCQNPMDYSWHDAITNNINILKEHKVAIYICHLALDFHEKYSTAMYFAKELIAQNEGRLSYGYEGFYGKKECEYYGNCVSNIMDKISAISPKPTFYQFLDQKIHKICCSPGGGNMVDNIKMAKDRGVDTYIVGVSEFRGKNSVSRNIDYFKEIQSIGINIIGLGHYETECLAMKGLVLDYFNEFNCTAYYFKDKFYE